jgi:hypothetical protein
VKVRAQPDAGRGASQSEDLPSSRRSTHGTVRVLAAAGDKVSFPWVGVKGGSCYDGRMGSQVRDVVTDAMKALRKVSGRCTLTDREKRAVAATRERMRQGYVFADGSERRPVK